MNVKYMVDKVFDPKNLDEGIRDVVVLLRDNGFKTFTSCDASEGHSFKTPTVGVILAHDLEKVIDDFLKLHNFFDYRVVKKHSDNEVWKQHYASETNGNYLFVQGNGLFRNNVL